LTPAHSANCRKLGNLSPAPSSPVLISARSRQPSCSPTGTSSDGSMRNGVS